MSVARTGLFGSVIGLPITSRLCIKLTSVSLLRRRYGGSLVLDIDPNFHLDPLHSPTVRSAHYGSMLTRKSSRKDEEVPYSPAIVNRLAPAYTKNQLKKHRFDRILARS